MAEVTLSSNEFKALSSATRVQIIKLLNGRNHTLTELAKKMEMALPSMKQHLDILLGSGLVEQIDSGRKWKYYSLTRKGKNILAGNEADTTILIVLGISSIALISVILLFIGSIASIQFAATIAREGSAMPSLETPSDKELAGEEAVIPSEEFVAPLEINWQWIYLQLTLIIVLAIIVGFFAAKVWKGKRLF